MIKQARHNDIKTIRPTICWVLLEKSSGGCVRIEELGLMRLRTRIVRRRACMSIIAKLHTDCALLTDYQEVLHLACVCF